MDTLTKYGTIFYDNIFNKRRGKDKIEKDEETKSNKKKQLYLTLSIRDKILIFNEVVLKYVLYPLKIVWYVTNAAESQLMVSGPFEPVIS